MKKTSKYIFLLLIILILTYSQIICQDTEHEVKVHYLGHSSFVLSFDNGINIVLDYGKENAWVNWGWDSPINTIGDLVPDVMTFSHQHEDHYDATRIPAGVTHILMNNDVLSIDGVEISSVRTCENNVNIESNTSFIFDYKGLKICHLGDAQAQIMNIADTAVRDKILSLFPDQFDLLFMTIEGQQKFIPQAEQFIRLLKPKVVIPIHHWSKSYLVDFVEYLKETDKSNSIYSFEIIDGAKYSLSKNNNTNTIKIVTLLREPYYNKNKRNTK